MRKRIIGLLLFASLPIGFVVMGSIYKDNKAETRNNHEDSRLNTRVYNSQLPLGEFKKRIERLILGLSTYFQPWKVVNASGSNNTINAEVPVFFFTDDLKVTLRQSTDNKTIEVDVSSRSRVGKSDLGENKRHILQLLEVMDRRFEQR